jgi:outer membrane protein assembly factor BamD (BamD/ComL family)
MRRRVCGLILVMLQAVVLPGWSQSSSAQTRDPAETLFVMAEEARASGRVEEAIGRYERVVAEYPASPWAARVA